MAITLASNAISDAEITDAIGLGDLEAAARLWVRHWPTALEAARQYVSPDEVPGLAAEALISTVSAIAIGRGPREDVSGFLVDAVRELGEDDEPPVPGPEHPAVFVSPMMTHAFSELEPELQDVLRTSVAVGQLDDEGVRALTVLQHYYLAEHTDRAESPACRRAHIAMMSVADSSATEGVPRKTWLHMSTCAWCTEAFHEVAFSNVALGALVDPAVLTPPVPAVGAPIESFETVAVPFGSEAFEAAEPAVEAVDFVEPVYVEPDEPLLVDARPVPEEEDDDEAAAVVVAAHAGSRRGRLVAVGIAAAAAISVVGVILIGQNDDTTAPTAAGTGSTTSAAPTDGATSGAEPDDELTPTEFTTVAGPVLSPNAELTATPTAKPTTKASTPAAPKPTKPATSPTPSSAPTTAQPTPTPEPTPTPTSSPTPTCTPLRHFFRLC